MGFLRNDLVEISILAVCLVVRGAWTVLVVGFYPVAGRGASGSGPGSAAASICACWKLLPHVRAFVWPGRRGFPFVRSAADVGASVALLRCRHRIVERA